MIRYNEIQYKLFLTIKEASFLYPLGKDRLKQLAKDGIINGGQDHSKLTKPWFFENESIKKYMESRYDTTSATIRKKILDINRRLHR